MSMKVFVIGARSPAAQAVIKRLREDHEVITGGRRDCDVQCDVTQPITVPAGTDVVVNFAAAFDDTDDAAVVSMVRTNVEGVLNVCIASRAAGVKQVVHISSLSVLHDQDSPYYTPYALTKRQGDELAEQYCAQHALPLAILRPSQLYGDEAGFAAHQPFFYAMVDKAAQGKDITIFGAHDALRNYLYAADFAEIITRVINQSVVGTYACEYPENVHFSDIAAAAQQAFGKGGAVVFLKDKPDIPDNIFRLDMSLYDTIRYRPHTSVEQGVEAIKIYRGDTRT